MAEKSDILFSEYIIDGSAMESTPADMLKECMPAPIWEDFQKKWRCRMDGNGAETLERQPEPAIDETSDRIPVEFSYDRGRAGEYLSAVFGKLYGNGFNPDNIDPVHPFSSTRIILAESIIESIWKEGHFSLNNIDMNALWRWDPAPVGNMAAFYTSVEAATGYMYDLGVKLTGADIMETDGRHEASFKVAGVKNWLPFNGMDEYSLQGAAFHDSDIGNFPEDGLSGQEESPGEMQEPEEKVWIWNTRKCPERIIHAQKDFPQEETESGQNQYGAAGQGTDSSCLIYIPFDTCPHRLGGSILSDILANGNGNGPEIMDPDYFIDCFEVVRELVEDGIVTAGATVGRGGLMTAVARMAGMGGKDGGGHFSSINLDISGIEQAYIKADAIRILFSEIPGVVMQIRDNDYDYVDSQLLLQDIAYYQLGHPAVSDRPRIRLAPAGRTGISAILAALMDGQSSEGED